MISPPEQTCTCAFMLCSSEDLYFWKLCQILFLLFGLLISLVLGLARAKVNIAPVQFLSGMNGSNACGLGEGWNHGYDRPRAAQDPRSVIIWQGFCYQVRATVATQYRALGWSEPTQLIRKCSGIFWCDNFAWGEVFIIIIRYQDIQYSSACGVLTLTQNPYCVQWLLWEKWRHQVKCSVKIWHWYWWSMPGRTQSASCPEGCIRPLTHPVLNLWGHLRLQDYPRCCTAYSI